MANDSLVNFEVRDRVAIITLNDPAHLNALGAELVKELLAAVRRAGDEQAARALLLRGSGRAFCAGADLGEIERRLTRQPPNAADYIGELMEQFGNPIIATLRALPMPTLAAVNGVAAGGGVGLALAADLVVAARSAYFYLPFVPSLALAPDMGATWALMHKVGRARALGLALTGHKLGAEQAELWGLIWKCVPDEEFERRTLEFARTLAALPGEATKSVRGLFDCAAVNDFDTQIAAEADTQRRLASREAFRKGVHAFSAKVKPNFA